MPLLQNLQEAFKQGLYCDIIITCEGRRTPCHKYVLATASEFFKTMFNEKFVEGKPDVIELKEDSPDAVDAVINHLYDIDYTEAVGSSERSKPQFHVGVYTTAQKYLLPELAEEALCQLSIVSEEIDNSCKIEDIFALLKLFGDHKLHHQFFEEQVVGLASKHLPALMKIEEFRAWMEEEGNSPVLDLALAAVDRGGAYVKHDITVCSRCSKAWVTGGFQKSSVRARLWLGQH
jgi:hypothetical protein